MVEQHFSVEALRDCYELMGRLNYEWEAYVKDNHLCISPTYNREFTLTFEGDGIVIIIIENFGETEVRECYDTHGGYASRKHFKETINKIAEKKGINLPGFSDIMLTEDNLPGTIHERKKENKSST